MKTPVVALVLLASSLLRAQPTTEYTLTAWRVEDGLPQGSVRSVTQTKDGYLWVATWNGLARFDGVRFTSFHTANTPALLSSSITTVFADSRGTLWIGTDGGGALRYTGGVFTRMDSARGIPALRILDISEDREGRVWICTDIGFYGVRNDSVIHFSRKDGLLRDYAGSVLPGEDGRLYFGMVDDVARVRIVNDSLIVEDTFPVGGLRLDVDERGALWYILQSKGLVRRAGNKALVDRRFSFAGARDVFLTGDGRLWLATDEGLYIVTERRVEFLKQVDGVNLDRVVVVFKDREGNIWLGNSGKGLLRLRPKHLESVSKSAGFASDFVMCGLQDRDGAIWIGTWDRGLLRLPPPNGVSNSPGAAAFRPFRTTTPPPAVVDIKEFRDGTIWMGTWAYGAVTIREDRVERFSVGAMRERYSVKSIGEGTNGSVWIGTAHDGVFHYTGTHEERWDTSRGLSSNEVSIVFCQRNGDIWIGTSGGGVNRISGGTVRTISRQNGLTDNFVSTILEDADGTLWIATVRGLNRWKTLQPDVPGSEGTLTPLTQASGLYDDAISQLTEDGEDLWIGSIHGVYRVSKRELNAVADGSLREVRCFRLGRSDGMVNEECGAKGNSSSWKSRDGRLWFSTSGGAVAFDPRAFRTTAPPPDVIIEEVSIENARTPLGETIVLQPGQSRLDVRYTGIDFSSPQSVRFRYKLEGFESGWNDAGRERAAHYTNIDPGSYVFRVTASNFAGVWNDTGAFVRVEVLPPLWRTWWFRIGAFVLLAGGLGWFVRAYEMRKIRRTMEEMERTAALERERLRIARDLHDELGARLTEIGLLTDLARAERRSADRTGRLAEIGMTARGVVESFREIVWTVSPQQDTLDSLVDFLEQYAARLLGTAGVRLRRNIPDDLPAVILRSDVRHAVFLAVKEALNNVVKHARANEVRYGITLDGGRAIVEVADDGVGIRRTSQRTSTNGMTNMRRRMEEVGGALEVVSMPRKGTTVRFVVPLGGSTQKP